MEELNIYNTLKEIESGIKEIKEKVKPQPVAKDRIYAGTEDYVDFFKIVIDAIGVDIDYKVEDVDGELEIVLH